MTINIISGHMHGIYTALLGLGITQMHQAEWVRSPVRINGVWRAKVTIK